MTKSVLILSAVALIAGLGAVDQAQAKPARHAVVGELASKAQLAREHARAVKAGDTANDPYSSASSDSLNQQQLAQAQAVMGANAAAAGDIQPGSINSSANGSANTSGVDANGTGNSSSSVNGSLTGSVTGETGTAAGNNSNAMPPQSPPVNGTTPDSQNTPQSGSTGATSPSSPQ